MAGLSRAGRLQSKYGARGAGGRSELTGTKKGGGGPNGRLDQRTPVAAGPAPVSRMRAYGCSISGGTRRSPHHRCPKVHTGASIVKKRRTTACIAGPSRDTHSSSGLGGRHIFMGDSGPSKRWGPDLRGRSGRKAQGRSEAARSTLGSPPTAQRTMQPGGDSPASGPHQTPLRSASP